MRLLVEFWRAEEGTTLIEYALIGSALSIMIIAGVRAMGTSLSNKWLGPLASGLN